MSKTTFTVALPIDLKDVLLKIADQKIPAALQPYVSTQGKLSFAIAELISAIPIGTPVSPIVPAVPAVPTVPAVPAVVAVTAAPKAPAATKVPAAPKVPAPPKVNPAPAAPKVTAEKKAKALDEQLAEYEARQKWHAKEKWESDSEWLYRIIPDYLNAEDPISQNTLYERIWSKHQEAKKSDMAAALLDLYSSRKVDKWALPTGETGYLLYKH